MKKNTKLAKLLKLSDVFSAVFINVNIFSGKRRNDEDSNVKELLMISEMCEDQCKH